MFCVWLKYNKLLHFYSESVFVILFVITRLKQQKTVYAVKDRISYKVMLGNEGSSLQLLNKPLLPHSPERTTLLLVFRGHSSHSQFQQKPFKPSAKHAGWPQLANKLSAVVKKPMNLQYLIALHHPAKILCHPCSHILKSPRISGPLKGLECWNEIAQPARVSQ